MLVQLEAILMIYPALSYIEPVCTCKKAKTRLKALVELEKREFN